MFKKNIFLQNYCPGKREAYGQRKQELDKLKPLVKQRTSIPGEIYQVDRFETWWNKNLATAVNRHHDGCCWVHLIVYDQESEDVKVFPPTNLECQWWGESKREQHSYLSSAQGETNWLRGMLTSSSNPILLIHPSCNYNYASFNNLVSEPYVKIDYSASTSDFKPLDIVWVKKQGRLIGIPLLKYFHVCVYLGKGMVCHIHSPSGKKNNGAKTDSWAEFLSGRIDLPIRFHPVVPFKHKDKIIEHIAKASVNKYKLGKYDLTGDNCEHFVNAIVLGIYYSQQVDNNPNLAKTSCRLTPGSGHFMLGGCEYSNNGKGSTIKLTDEINTKYLGEFNNRVSQDFENRIEQAKSSYIPTDRCVVM